MHVTAPSNDPFFFFFFTTNYFQFVFTTILIIIAFLYLFKTFGFTFFQVDDDIHRWEEIQERRRREILRVELGEGSGSSSSGGGGIDVECVVCGKKGDKKCSGCKVVRYCSGECQSKHWRTGHKLKCKEFLASSRCKGKACTTKGEPSSELVKLKKVLFSYEEFVRLYSWDKLEFQPCGLVNCGNSCYANVVLQCLSCTKPLIAYLLEKRHRRECRRNNWCFMCELQFHFERIVQSSQPFSPINILSHLPSICSSLGYGKQEDAHEFMRFAIDTMQSVCLDEFGGEKALHSSSQETTLIQYIFGGHLQSQVACAKCNKLSYRYENMMDLTVEIQGAASLEQCLDQFTAKEWLDGENMYKCEGCNDYVKACKRLTIHQAPNILTIALKRFQSGRFGKINKRVTFPETLDLGPYMSKSGDGNDLYQLYAVVVHVDMLNASYFGHYVCYTRNYSGTWYRIDDEKVTMVELEEVLRQGAYMLLYNRTCVRATYAKLLDIAVEEDQQIMEVDKEPVAISQKMAESCTATMIMPSETSKDTEGSDLQTEDPENGDLIRRADPVEMDVNDSIKFDFGSLDTVAMDDDHPINLNTGIFVDAKGLDNNVNGNLGAPEIIPPEKSSINVLDSLLSRESAVSALSIESEKLCSSQDRNLKKRSCDTTSRSAKKTSHSEENTRPMFSRGFLDKFSMSSRNSWDKCNGFQIPEDRSNTNKSEIRTSEVVDKDVGNDSISINYNAAKIDFPVGGSLSKSTISDEITSSIEDVDCNSHIVTGLKNINGSKSKCGEDILLPIDPMDCSLQNSVCDAAENLSDLVAVSESEMLHGTSLASYKSPSVIPSNIEKEAYKLDVYSSCFEEKKEVISSELSNTNGKISKGEWIHRERNGEIDQPASVSLNCNGFLNSDFCHTESMETDYPNRDIQSLLPSSPDLQPFASRSDGSQVSAEISHLIETTLVSDARYLQCEAADTGLDFACGLEDGNQAGSSYTEDLEYKCDVSVSSAEETSNKSELYRPQSKQKMELKKDYHGAQTVEVKPSKIVEKTSCSEENSRLPFTTEFLDKSKKQRHPKRNGKRYFAADEIAHPFTMNSNGNSKPHCSLLQDNLGDAISTTRDENIRNSSGLAQKIGQDLFSSGFLNGPVENKSMDMKAESKMVRIVDETESGMIKKSNHSNGYTNRRDSSVFSPGFLNRPMLKSSMNVKAESTNLQKMKEPVNQILNKNNDSNGFFHMEIDGDLFSPGFLNKPVQKKPVSVKAEPKKLEKMDEVMDESNDSNRYSFVDDSSMFSDENPKTSQNVMGHETVQDFGSNLYSSGLHNKNSPKKPLGKYGKELDRRRRSRRL